MNYTFFLDLYMSWHLLFYSRKLSLSSPAVPNSDLSVSAFREEFKSPKTEPETAASFPLILCIMHKTGCLMGKSICDFCLK